MSIPKKPRKKALEEDLNSFTNEELILRVKQLTAHNNQLKNVISKKLESESTIGGSSKKERNFDFTKSSKRHIFLKLFYLGWDYQGFATQEDTNKTIEWELFEALRKSCLIEDRTTSNYHRCGRTDKGVSAFGQVISIDVRSRVIKNHDEEHTSIRQINNDSTEKDDKPHGKEDANQEYASGLPAVDEHNVEGELEYCKILNRLLPSSIRAVAWSPVAPEESARFNCKKRTYKYFFPRGNLNLQNMEKAAELLVGEHDFRNLCKMDVANGVTNFERTIVSVSIEVISTDQVNESLRDKPFEFTYPSENEGNSSYDPKDADFQKNIIDHAGSVPESKHSSVTKYECNSGQIIEKHGLQPDKVCNDNSDESEILVTVDPESYPSPYDMCELTVVGQAFLWHQIRCIVSVLFLVGQGKEDPSVVKHLLDVESYPRKPQYGLASEIPLNLFATEYESSLHWVYDRESIFSIVKDLQKEWAMLSVRSTMIRQMISELQGDSGNFDGSELTNCLMQGVRPRAYTPLLQRNTCESLEDRIKHYVKRKRLEVDEETE